MRNRRNDQSAVALEPNEAPIKEVIDAWRQEQPVLTIETFFIRAVTPRLAMASDQMDRIRDARDAAALFDFHDTLLEQALATSCSDDGFPIRRGDRNITFRTRTKP